MNNADKIKARTILKWIPVFNIDAALRYTFGWYKCYYEKKDIIKYTEQIIEELEKNAF